MSTVLLRTLLYFKECTIAILMYENKDFIHCMIAPPQTLGLRLRTYILDDCSHLFIALIPNEHCDYPRRAPFIRPPIGIVWSSWLGDNYPNKLSGNWIYTGSQIMMYFPCHVVTTSRVGHYVIHIITTDSKSIMDYSRKRRCMSILV